MDKTINPTSQLIVNGLFRNRFTAQIYDKRRQKSFVIVQGKCRKSALADNALKRPPKNKISGITISLLIVYNWNVIFLQSDRFQTLAKASAC